MVTTILKELREFRTENNKRWELNNKRWEANDKHWEENEKRWIENDKRWDENNKKWEENTTTLARINERLVVLEEGRKKDRKDLLGILDTMQKSIDNQFSEMKKDMNSKFEKVFTLQKLNEMEHQEFRKLLLKHDKRINFQSARLKYLEEWKEQFDMGEFTAV